jgi:hypothetical protein
MWTAFEPTSIFLRSPLIWAADEQGQPPATPIGGIGDMFAGREVWIPITLSPGQYFIICQIKDSSDGRPHYQRGMFREFEVR